MCKSSLVRTSASSLRKENENGATTVNLTLLFGTSPKSLTLSAMRAFPTERQHRRDDDFFSFRTVVQVQTLAIPETRAAIRTETLGALAGPSGPIARNVRLVAVNAIFIPVGIKSTAWIAAT